MTHTGSARSTAELAAFVRDWNRKHRPGAVVGLRVEGEVRRLGPTADKAYVMGCTPVVEVAGLHGVWHLDKLEVME